MPLTVNMEGSQPPTSLTFVEDAYCCVRRGTFLKLSLILQSTQVLPSTASRRFSCSCCLTFQIQVKRTIAVSKSLVSRYEKKKYWLIKLLDAAKWSAIPFKQQYW